MSVLGIEALIPQTMAGRIGGVALAVVIVVATLVLANLRYSVSFFNGFLVAVGLFISVDLLLVHWMMELHRITSGEEAIWLEILLFVTGLAFVIVGLRREIRSAGLVSR